MRGSGMIVAGLLLAACGNGLGPETPLELSVEMDGRVVFVGDSVRFVAAAYNPTDDTVDVGGLCGYSLDVIVTPPGGEETSVYSLQLAGAVPTCDRKWYHSATPGQLIELELWWQAAAQSGTYTAATVERCDNGYFDSCPRSKSIEFEVE